MLIFNTIGRATKSLTEKEVTLSSQGIKISDGLAIELGLNKGDKLQFGFDDNAGLVLFVTDTLTTGATLLSEKFTTAGHARLKDKMKELAGVDSKTEIKGGLKIVFNAEIKDITSLDANAKDVAIDDKCLVLSFKEVIEPTAEFLTKIEKIQAAKKTSTSSSTKAAKEVETVDEEI